ncbi:MAG: uroporphyrinogen-III synthase [Pseudomonadota bacterium]|nr:uroporphyrinogen-III synthase [Pseudomonadota bacterium]
MKSLKGLNIALTRPSGQNRVLESAVRGHGGEALIFPLLETKPLADSSSIVEWEQAIASYDWLIFVSATSVQFSWPYIAPHLANIKARFASIGPTTAAALHRHGIEEVLLPEKRFDSEALLECLSKNELEGARITIVRGTHGRELLGDTLEKFGATVVRIGVYERLPNFSVASDLIGAVREGQCHALCLTSSEAVEVLESAMVSDRVLRTVPVFVPHLRIMERALSVGFEKVYCTEGGDTGLLQGLLAWRESITSN